MSDIDMGLNMKEAHLPDQTGIEAYGDGGFRFANMSHKGSLMCLPSGIYGWNVKTISDFSQKSFEKALSDSGIELMLIGTGYDLVPLSDELKAVFEAQNIRIECMSTGAAVRTYNVLLAEKRSLGAALLAVE